MSSGKTQGVFALASPSPTGTGTLSISGGESNTGGRLISCCAVGVWGDTNQTTPGAAALVGTADDAQGLYLQNNSTGHLTASINNSENTKHQVEVLNVSGVFGSCHMDTDGNLFCSGSLNGPGGAFLGSTGISGDLGITGNLTKGSGSFKIDHPLDPANKYLYHSFVESPDMMNIYNGNVTTDKRGLAVVVLPDYFEALNSDFRYQLTVMGHFAQAIVAKEMKHNRFTIGTSRPGMRVSWQVTGIRHDAYADAHRIQVEEDKPQQERGKYLHPELFGASSELAIGPRR